MNDIQASGHDLPGSIAEREPRETLAPLVAQRSERLDLLFLEDERGSLQSPTGFQCHASPPSDHMASVSESLATVNNSATIKITMETRTLGDIVRSRRLELGLTQAELAERLDMSQRWVSNLELGNVGQSRLKTLRALASALSLDIEDLIIATGQATTRAGAKAVAEAVPDPDPLDDPVLRVSFSRLPALTTENREKVATLIEDLYRLQELGEVQNTKAGARRKAR